ncbi:ATP/GTP-binding protein [Streptomyces sp. NPDC057694]|uniref:ATP/GTP-binding protein n=1 Tax=Streptomyces sp. NPDC057694 TaxID=3346216 RepID=UPI0036C3842A
MLRQHTVTAAAGLGMFLLSSAVGSAYADGPGVDAGAACSSNSRFCRVEVDAPGSQGGHDAATDSDAKSSSGKKSRWTCTYKKADPQPPADSLDWEGHKPTDGAVYEQTCSFDGSLNTVVRMVWAADPPDDGVDPAQLAQQAVDSMKLDGPDIDINPKPGGRGLVGMPVWMAVEPSATTFGPNTASASAGGVTVTATAKVSKIVWSMGDGTSVTCNGPGSVYHKSYGMKRSPDCGHIYRTSSTDAAGGTFAVTATATWNINWQATGLAANGQLTEVRDSQVALTIVESQAVNQ